MLAKAYVRTRTGEQTTMPDECPAVVDAEGFRAYLREAQQNLRMRSSPHLKQFFDQAKTPVDIMVPYEMRLAPGKGVGAFTLTDVPQGTQIEADNVRNWIWIPEHLAHVASDFTKAEMQLAMGWCSQDWWCEREGGVLCQLSAGRLLNDDRNPTAVSCPDGTCAARDIKAGEEITNDYETLGLDSQDSHRVQVKMVAMAANGE